MAKQGQHQPSDTSERKQEREQDVAKGGSTRASSPRSGRSGSDSNADKGGGKAPKNRAESQRELKPGGTTVDDREGAGAPQGGQRDGRQGDQEGLRR